MEKTIKTENIEFQQQLDAAIADMQAAETHEQLAVARQKAENALKKDKKASVCYLAMEQARLANVAADKQCMLGAINAACVREIKEANRRRYAAERSETFREAQKCCNAAWLAETLAVAKQRGIITDYSLTIPAAVEKGGDDE